MSQQSLPAVEQRAVPADVAALEAEFSSAVKGIEKAIATNNSVESEAYAWHLLLLARSITAKRSQAATGGNEALTDGGAGQ